MRDKSTTPSNAAPQDDKGGSDHPAPAVAAPSRATLNLLPCPFCGGDTRTDEGHNEPATQFVECKQCDALIVGPLAYSLWNTRRTQSETERTPSATAMPVKLSEMMIPMLDAINEPCKGCGKRPVDFVSGSDRCSADSTDIKCSGSEDA